MIKLEPHALERCMLIHVSSAPPRGIRVHAIEGLADFSRNHRNAAESAMKAVTRQYCRSCACIRHSRLRPLYCNETWQWLLLGFKGMNRSIALSPDRICPSPNDRIIRATNQLTSFVQVAREMGRHGVVQQFCCPKDFGDRIAEAAPWHGLCLAAKVDPGSSPDDQIRRTNRSRMSSSR